LLRGADPVADCTIGDPFVTPDPQLLNERLNDFIVTDTRPDADEMGTMVDAAWVQWLEGKGGAEMQQMRRKQIMQLGRYGHQQAAQWDDYPLEEFVAIYDALVEVMKGEDSIQQTVETDG
jgi:hypothetical protein